MAALFARGWPALHASVAAELGFLFVDINMKNNESYRVYRKYLFTSSHRSSRDRPPTYILVDFRGDDFALHGELTGSTTRDCFRVSLEDMAKQSEFARGAEEA